MAWCLRIALQNSKSNTAGKTKRPHTSRSFVVSVHRISSRECSRRCRLRRRRRSSRNRLVKLHLKLLASDLKSDSHRSTQTWQSWPSPCIFGDVQVHKYALSPIHTHTLTIKGLQMVCTNIYRSTRRVAWSNIEFKIHQLPTGTCSRFDLQVQLWEW